MVNFLYRQLIPCSFSLQSNVIGCCNSCLYSLLLLSSEYKEEDRGGLQAKVDGERG